MLTAKGTIPPASPEALKSLHLLGSQISNILQYLQLLPAICLARSAPSHNTSPCPSLFPDHPISSKGILCFVQVLLAPSHNLAPPGPRLSHLLAKKAPTVTRAPSATAPVSTVLTDAQFPSRRRRASSRAPSPYRAVNSAQPPLLWIQSARRVSR